MVSDNQATGIDIREGVLDNMAAVLDPAFPDLDPDEQKSIFQVKSLLILVLESVFCGQILSKSVLLQSVLQPKYMLLS